MNTQNLRRIAAAGIATATLAIATAVATTPAHAAIPTPATVVPISTTVRPTAVPVKTTSTELKAKLHAAKAYPQASGTATYTKKGRSSKLTVQLTGANKLAGKKVTVRANGKVVGKVTVASNGQATLTRSNPTKLRAGEVVKIQTKSGKVIVHGNLAKR